MTDSPTTPDDDKKVTPPATTQEPEATSSPEPKATPEAPARESQAAEDTKPSPEEGAEPQAEPTAKPARKRRRWGAICLDAFLILLLLAVLAAAGYYFRLTAERYHVPTPMEQILCESEELDLKYNELLPKANHADTQLHMRARLAQLEGQMARLSALLSEKKASIDEQHGQVLAIQYAIRQADETNRSIARSLLPGMPVGNVVTTTGKGYHNATIYRLDKRHIYLRFPEGQARFPISQLVKDNLPDIARYAFGELDLIDMSDFEQTGDPTAIPGKAVTAAKPAARADEKKEEAEGYDPTPGAPVLDADANRTTTSRVPEGETAEDDNWEAPGGDLPM